MLIFGTRLTHGYINHVLGRWSKFVHRHGLHHRRLYILCLHFHLPKCGPRHGRSTPTPCCLVPRCQVSRCPPLLLGQWSRVVQSRVVSSRVFNRPVLTCNMIPISRKRCMIQSCCQWYHETTQAVSVGVWPWKVKDRFCVASYGWPSLPYSSVLVTVPFIHSFIFVYYQLSKRNQTWTIGDAINSRLFWRVAYAWDTIRCPIMCGTPRKSGRAQAPLNVLVFRPIQSYFKIASIVFV